MTVFNALTVRREALGIFEGEKITSLRKFKGRRMYFNLDDGTKFPQIAFRAQDDQDKHDWNPATEADIQILTKKWWKSYANRKLQGEGISLTMLDDNDATAAIPENAGVEIQRARKRYRPFTSFRDVAWIVECQHTLGQAR